MGLTLTEKIIKEHLVSGILKAGEEIGIGIDQTLTQDATGTMACLQLEAIGVDRVKTEISVSYVDHNMLQTDFKNMDDHRYLQSVAARFGIYFSRPGNGICHQVHLERFGIPGKTLIGSDSHTPTNGGMGMLAIGSGGVDVAVAMAGGPFYLKMPEVVGVELSGKLNDFCSAKDVILTLLKTETVKGGIGKVYEYFGSGVMTLTVPERATITNMGAELGATTSIFPSDEATREFLRVQNREKSWKPVSADSGAVYSRVIKINLNDIVPMAARPHMPDNVVPVHEIEGIKADQIAIGSCTNSSINDLAVAADILEGNIIAPGVSLGVSPGSRQALMTATDLGITSVLIASGARILESACGPCIGMGFAPSSGAVSVRTFNRNFTGRSGTKDAGIYLVSPETAAATALKGVLTDPRSLGSFPRRDLSSKIIVNDAMIIKPPEDGSGTEIVRGPNIKPVPEGKILENHFKAQIILKAGDNITTDDIMPAGAEILPFRSNIPEISKYVFSAIDPEFYKKAIALRKSVIIGGENYGQGSSREHAALAPMYLGVRAVIAKSFARIHRANLVNFGILPLTFRDRDDYNDIKPGDVIEFGTLKESLKAGKPVSVSIAGGSGEKKKIIVLECNVADRFIDILLSGGLLNYTRKHSIK
ncbi:MAG: aconitate hydratase [Spirochaetes bacterium]|nr:aconitate hydratase [Spirochaetota bacterium]